MPQNKNHCVLYVNNVQVQLNLRIQGTPFFAEGETLVISHSSCLVTFSTYFWNLQSKMTEPIKQGI